MKGKTLYARMLEKNKLDKNGKIIITKSGEPLTEQNMALNGHPVDVKIYIEKIEFILKNQDQNAPRKLNIVDCLAILGFLPSGEGLFYLPKK